MAAQPDGSFGPVLETTVGGVLREAAERAGGTAALVEGTADRQERRRWSYGELLADSNGSRVPCWAGSSLASGSRYGRRTARSGYCWSSGPRWQA